MGTVLVIKGADFSENALAQVDFTIPEGSLPTASNKPKNLALMYTQSGCDFGPLSWSGVSNHIAIFIHTSYTTRVAVADVSRYVGRTVVITRAVPTSNNAIGGFAFLSDDSSRQESMQLANIATTDYTGWVTHVGGHLLDVNELIVQSGLDNHNATITVTIPNNAKWLAFLTTDQFGSETSAVVQPEAE